MEWEANLIEWLQKYVSNVQNTEGFAKFFDFFVVACVNMWPPMMFPLFERVGKKA